jgi:hypothetical protein
MAVDLSDLIEDMKSELSVPGETSYATATDAQWVAQLRNAFWEAVLDGIINGYVESDGIINPSASGGADLGRDFQQVIIYYAGIRIMRNRLLDLKTRFRAEAGPVKYEIEQSAQVLKGLLDELVRRRNVWLTRLSDLGSASTYYTDMVIARTDSISFGDTNWVA